MWIPHGPQLLRGLQRGAASSGASPPAPEGLSRGCQGSLPPLHLQGLRGPAAPWNHGGSSCPALITAGLVPTHVPPSCLPQQLHCDFYPFWEVAAAPVLALALAWLLWSQLDPKVTLGPHREGGQDSTAQAGEGGRDGSLWEGGIIMG